MVSPQPQGVDGRKPGPIATTEGHLAKHILPRFGACAVDAITETMVQEFVADLKRASFERRKPSGALIKTYCLSRKTILNIVGVLKLVLGRKVWMTWELDLGKPKRTRNRTSRRSSCGRSGLPSTSCRSIPAASSIAGKPVTSTRSTSDCRRHPRILR